MDFQDLTFSAAKSKARIAKALRVFPKLLLMKLIGFVLYLLGAPRRAVAERIGMPEESLKTAIRVATNEGFDALQDRRISVRSVPIPLEKPEVTPIRMTCDDGRWTIVLAGGHGEISVPDENSLQLRTLVLSLLGARLVEAKESARVLGLSESHCRSLAAQLRQDDVDKVLMDKRQGQQREYRMGSAQKSALIQEVVERGIAGTSTSSGSLAEAIAEQTQVQVSPRTVRLYIEKLGLKAVRESLPGFVADLKKTAESD